MSQELESKISEGKSKRNETSEKIREVQKKLLRTYDYIRKAKARHVGQNNSSTSSTGKYN